MSAGGVAFRRPPVIAASAAVAGRKEGEGPLGNDFDLICEDTRFGQKNWEKAESRMQQLALERALCKAGMGADAVELLFAGDLLNQCVTSSFAMRSSQIPYVGLYGACSTMAEGLVLAASAVSGGFARCAAAITSSHFCTAERQYRTPLAYGCQRTPTAQWTATAAGCAILRDSGHGVRVTHAVAGRIVDPGIRDANNMGAAMAPAACDTLLRLFAMDGCAPESFDRIITGDLGWLGGDILLDLLATEGVAIAGRYDDCGRMIYDASRQDVHMGGSGCGCSAGVICGHVMRELRAGRWRRVAFAGTGALLSPLTTQQGESIPGICHAVVLDGGTGEDDDR